MAKKMNTTTKTITLEFAQTLSGDSEAIKRGYVSEEIIADARQLAEAVIKMETFGQMGYLACIGEPHHWWQLNCRKYRLLEQKELYSQARKFSIMLKIADYLTHNLKVEAVKSTITALRLTNQTNTEDYRLLQGWVLAHEFVY